MLHKFDSKNLQYVKVSRIWLVLAVLVIGLGCSIISVGISLKMFKVEILSDEARLIVMREDNQFSRDKLREYILQLNIKYPHIVLAQAELESGLFTSPIFKENNNLFGMKQAKLRPTTNTGENKGHACFNTWRESVVDYAFYSATYLNDIHSETEYLNYLGQSYAEDTAYVSKLRVIIERNKQR
jgi:hypothetical protein